MTQGKKLARSDVIAVCKVLETGATHREISRRMGLSITAVQRAIDSAATWWLQAYRSDRQAEYLDNLSDPPDLT